jgi:hypothetical protein
MGLFVALIFVDVNCRLTQVPDSGSEGADIRMRESGSL